MDFEPDLDKHQTQAVHDFIHREILNEGCRLKKKRKALQEACQIICNLNTLIAFDNTADFYVKLCTQLFVVCQALEIKDFLVQKIIERFGSDCFFLSCFLKQP